MPACPDCRIALTAVPSGSILASRCDRCRGVWLDPASFERLCREEEASPETTIVPSPAQTATRPGGPPDDRVRYRACPECGDVMNRSNFARVSGVVIDVCRPHGAWFDRGELGAIRRFLRQGGLRRLDRLRRIERQAGTSLGAPVPISRGSSADDIYDVLVGNDASWDVPSRIPRLPIALFFALAGGWLLWRAFQPDGHYDRGLGSGEAWLGLASLYFAWRAFGEWLERRGR